MRAIQVLNFGGPEQMLLQDIPVPRCGPHDVLVGVVAAGVNPVDWKLRSGAMSIVIKKNFPFVLGQDGAGIVAAVGGEVTDFVPGDEVFFYAEFARGGSYADYVSVDAAQVALEPRTASFATAAALPTPGQAAWTALEEIAHLQSGQRILIHGAGGALGSIAVQLAQG